MHNGPRMKLTFGKLPLVEAAARATLASPVPLTFATINAMQQHLAADFPLIAQPTSIEMPPGLQDGAIVLGPGQIPGVVFAGNPQGLSVSIHSQVLVARWLKQPNGPHYPRFESIKTALWKARDAFLKASGSRVEVIVVNMSYVNFVRPDSKNSILRDYFSNLAQLELTREAKQISKLEVAWGGNDEVDLRLNLEQVSLKFGEEQLDGFRLVTVAGMKVLEEKKAELVLDQVHDRLQYFFRDLLSERAKSEWELEVSDA